MKAYADTPPPLRLNVLVRDLVTGRIGRLESKRSGNLWLVRYRNDHGEPDDLPTLQQEFCFERVHKPRRYTTTTTLTTEEHERRLAYQRQWAKANRAKHSQYRRRFRQELFKEVVVGYGGACACCGETELAFLTLDHVNGGGGQHRKAINNAYLVFHRRLIREQFPPDFQVLCANCHLAKDRRGGCPHQIK